MKKIIKSFIFMAALALLSQACAKLDYEETEFWKQEVYIIGAESTAATERVVSGGDPLFTFVDTLKIIDDDYNKDTIVDTQVGTARVVFKIGIGGSQMAHQDIHVKVAFNQELIDDYNIERSTNVYLPDASLYTTNIPFDESNQCFNVLIKEGEAASSLIFTFPVERDKMEEFLNYGIPLTIIGCDELPLTRQYTTFLRAGLVINQERFVNWNGRPIPRLPIGRYHSARIASNAAENQDDGTPRKWKYIMPLDDEEGVTTRYMVWGHGNWSWERFGYHGSGWMYDILYLNDSVAGTYTMQPILAGNAKFPSRTFAYSTVPRQTETSKYDPSTKTLTIYYENLIGNDYADILTFEEYSLDITPCKKDANTCPVNWSQVRNTKGYKYWLPIDAPIDGYDYGPNPNIYPKIE